MIRDAVEVTADERIYADVCIVGGGPAGLTVAAQLSEAGQRVVVLEAGGGEPPPGGEPYPAIRNVGRRYDLAGSRCRGIGGTALAWHLEAPVPGGLRARMRELDEVDLSGTGGVRGGWPIGSGLMEPYYRRARSLLGMPDAEPDRAPRGGDVAVRVFGFAPSSVFTSVLPGRLARSADTLVLTRATVVQVVTDGPGGAARHVMARGPQGGAFTVHASVFVIAGGGIENARLLLTSRDHASPGLGNAHGHVGKHFMEHPHFSSALVLPTHERLPRDERWDVVDVRGHPVQRTYGLAASVRCREGLPDSAYYIEPRPWQWPVPVGADGTRIAADLAALRHLRRVLTAGEVAPGLAQDLLTALSAGPRMAAFALRQAWALAAASSGRTPLRPAARTVVAMAEQEPSRRSQVRLGPEVDAWGVQQVELDWQLTDADVGAMHRSQALLTEGLSRLLDAPVVGLLTVGEPFLLGWGYHHMGTTRMSVRSEDGVVDRDCRLHEASNVYVAGSSVFPTGGSANPTLTVVALAIRLADRIAVEVAAPVLHGPA